MQFIYSMVDDEHLEYKQIVDSGGDIVGTYAAESFYNRNGAQNDFAWRDMYGECLSEKQAERLDMLWNAVDAIGGTVEAQHVSDYHMGFTNIKPRHISFARLESLICN